MGRCPGCHCIVHADPVKRNTSCADIVIAEFRPADIAVNIAEDRKALALKIHEFLVVLRISVYRTDIRAERKDDLVRRADDLLDRDLPSLMIIHERLCRGFGSISVAIGMARKGPAVGLHRLCDLSGLRAVRIIIVFRMLEKEILLGLIQIRTIRTFLIVVIRAVSEHAVVPGEGNGRLRSPVGEIRVFTDKCIDQRDHVVITDLLHAVYIREKALDLSVLVEYQLVRVPLSSVLAIGMIIAQVVL